MKINPGFELREVCGEYILLAYGEENIDFTKVISMNDSAALIWRALENTEFTLQTVVDILLAEYEIDVETATHDAEQLLQHWKCEGLVG
jgi:hypothetical protein